MAIQSQDTEQVKFSNLDHNVREKLDISWTEYVLLDMVYHLSAKYGYCYMSTSVMAQRLGLTFNGAKYLTARLIERELIVQTDKGLVCGPGYLNIAYLKPIAKSAKIAKSALQKVQPTAKSARKLQKVQPIAKSSGKNNSKIYSRSTDTYVDPAAPAVPDDDAVRRENARKFLGLLIKTLGYSDQVKLTDGRLRKLKVRRRNFTPQEMLTAAQRLGADDYMQGGNENAKRYGTIDYFLRSDEIIDKYLNSEGSENARIERSSGKRAPTAAELEHAVMKGRL